MIRVVDLIEKRPWVGWLLFGGTLAAVFAVGLLWSSIVERRGETARLQTVAPLAAWEPRNEVWGANYPREYEGYAATRQTDFASKYGGSAHRDYLEETPGLVVLWAGYAFAKGYDQARGHAWAVQDVRHTPRTNESTPGTCWACKSTDVPRVMNELGPEKFYASKWVDLGPQIANPIGCQDCHDPSSLQLRISRPALAEAWQRRGGDLAQATHQEMRSLVCAQCHVEYHFAKQPANYLTFPWDQGFSAEDMERYYDEKGFSDWTHALSRAPMLKAQHPDFELYMTGIHARRGVACADCHMPYRSQGGVKFTDHHIQSPLANVANSCAVCHRESEDTLRRDVEARQDQVMELRALAEDALVHAHFEAKAAWEAGASEAEMGEALTLIRHAQWRWDWVAAANGAGFHAPHEALRVLGTSIQKAEAARRALTAVLWRHGVTGPVALPDLSSKEKAQRAIGLDPEALRRQKEDQQPRFTRWDEEAAARQGAWGR